MSYKQYTTLNLNLTRFELSNFFDYSYSLIELNIGENYDE